MTSTSHVTSLGTCPVDSPWAVSYRLSIGTIPLSGLDSEIFSPKVGQRLLHDDVTNDVLRPVSAILEDHIDTPKRGTFVLKYRPIPTRILGEEAF